LNSFSDLTDPPHENQCEEDLAVYIELATNYACESIKEAMQRPNAIVKAKDAFRQRHKGTPVTSITR